MANDRRRPLPGAGVRPHSGRRWCSRPKTAGICSHRVEHELFGAGHTSRASACRALWGPHCRAGSPRCYQLGPRRRVDPPSMPPRAARGGVAGVGARGYRPARPAGLSVCGSSSTRNAAPLCAVAADRPRRHARDRVRHQHPPRPARRTICAPAPRTSSVAPSTPTRLNCPFTVRAIGSDVPLPLWPVSPINLPVKAPG